MHLQNIFKIRALTRLSTFLPCYILYIYIGVQTQRRLDGNFFRVRHLLQQLWMLAGSR